MAARLDVPFALVLTGVTGPTDAPFAPEPRWVANDLATLVTNALGPKGQLSM
jgi:hypothetical protein